MTKATSTKAVTGQPTNPIDVSGKPSVFLRFGSLFLSKDNVRRGKASEQGIIELAAMIESQGLLNALHVSAEIDDAGQATGRSGVDAGGRRYLALSLLCERGQITADTLIECKEIGTGRACEVSLTENLSQEHMHPADEYAAFQTLVDSGATAETIAAKFGVTVLHVQRRLKMAKVAPELLALFRLGELTLDQIQALASIDDQERQVQVWNGLPTWSRSAQQIKRKLTEEEISATDPRVKVIGLPNYLAAGGSVRNDLFAEGDDMFLTDVGLVDMLVGEAIQDKVAALQAEGWAWVEAFEKFGYEERSRFCEPAKVYLPETEAQTAQREALEAERDDIEAKRDKLYDNDNDDDNEDEIEELDTAIGVLEARAEALQAARLDIRGLDKSLAGAIVILGQDGLEVKVGLVVREHGHGSSHSGTGTPKVKVKADVPEKLMQNLTSCKTVAIQALMLSNQSVTLAALAHRLAITVCASRTMNGGNIQIDLRQSRGDLERNAPTLGDSPALKLLDAERARWRDALPKDESDWFAWFLEQPQARVLSFIVFATALSTDAITGSMDRISRATPLAQALNLDMAQWWQPTAQSYFDLVPKSKMAEAVRDTAGEAAAGALLKMKSPEAIAHAVKHTQGTGWLPVPLRSVTGPHVCAADSSASEGEVVDAQPDPQDEAEDQPA